MSYLISLLRGEAAKVLAGLVVSEKNYDYSKTLVVSKFGNRKELLKLNFDEVLSVGDVPLSSLDLIKDYLSKTKMNLRNLESMGVNIEEYSLLLGPKILEKLPNELKLSCTRMLSFNNKDVDQIWSINDILQCIEIEIKNYDIARQCMYKKAPIKTMALSCKQ